MKLIALKIFLLLTATLTTHKIFKTTIINKEKTSIGFVADSGYVIQGNLNSLIKIDANDTLHIKDYYTTDTDTLGKYYKMSPGNYIACVRISGVYGYPAHVIYETLQDGTILKKEQFYSVMNLCCWDNIYNGFEKHGDYVSYRACSNGTAFCSTDIYLFKELKSMDDQETISRTLWAAIGGEDYYTDITSTMEVRSDTVIVHYTNKLLKEKRHGYKVKKTSYYSAIYTKHSSKWQPVDSITLKKFMYNQN